MIIAPEPGLRVLRAALATFFQACPMSMSELPPHHRDPLLSIQPSSRAEMAPASGQSMPGGRLPMRCRICGHDGPFLTHQIAESMYGTGKSFTYAECSVCGSLSIAQVPEDLSRYYPGDYYSQAPSTEPPGHQGVKRWLIEQSAASRSIHPRSAFRSLASAVLPVPTDYVEIGTYLQHARLRSRQEGILDVGCGSSPRRLAAMWRCGFRNVEGIDPFLSADVDYYGVPVRKCTIEQVTRVFGLVMFHHSLEHVLDPLADLRVAHRLLRSQGLCIVRIPVADGYLWREFGTAWAELDAPRHLQVPTRKGIELLARKAGFEVEGLQFDSQSWELEASRKIAEGVPMKRQVMDAQALERRPADQALAARLNAAADGGRACFFLRRR